MILTLAAYRNETEDSVGAFYWGHAWVPIDDHNCWAWTYDFHPTRALTKEERAAMEAGQGLHCKYVPGSYRPLANKDNDYLIDRAAQKAGYARIAVVCGAWHAPAVHPDAWPAAAADAKLRQAAEEQAAERNAALRSLGRAAEARAGEIAKKVEGVKSVKNQLTVEKKS